MSEVSSTNKRGELPAGTILDIKIDGTSIVFKSYTDIQFPVTVPVGKKLEYELSLNLRDE